MPTARAKGPGARPSKAPPNLFIYATASGVLRGRRFILALCRLKATMTMDEGLDTLLKRVQAPGITSSLGLLDRGLYRGNVIRQLITRKQPVSMPAIKPGKKPRASGAPSGTSVMARWKNRSWTTWTLSRTKDGQVTGGVQHLLGCRVTPGHHGLCARKVGAHVGLRHPSSCPSC
jgi:hypothetical protein